MGDKGFESASRTTGMRSAFPDDRVVSTYPSLLAVGFALSVCTEFAALSTAFEADGHGVLAAACFVAGMAAGLFVCHRMSRAAATLSSPKAKAALAAAATSVSAALALSLWTLPSEGGIIVALALVCFAILGCLCAIGEALWLETQREINVSLKDAGIGKAYLGAAVLAAILIHLAEPARQIVTALLLPVSLWALLAVRPIPLPADAPVRSEAGVKSLSRRTFALASVACGCCAFVLACAAPAASTVPVTLGFVFIGVAALVMVALHARGRILSFPQTLACAMPATTAALVLCAGTVPAASSWAEPVALLTYAFLTMLCLIGLLNFSLRFGEDSMRFISRKREHYLLGFLGGIVVGEACRAAAIDVGLSCFVLVIATLCLFAALPVFTYTPLQNGGGLRESVDATEYVKVGGADDSLDVQCERLAEHYALTKREGEVLALLAKGYNASSIAAELVVSRSTVKSHMDHVFKKLDVHTQQELIALARNE